MLPPTPPDVESARERSRSPGIGDLNRKNLVAHEEGAGHVSEFLIHEEGSAAHSDATAEYERDLAEAIAALNDGYYKKKAQKNGESDPKKTNPPQPHVEATAKEQEEHDHMGFLKPPGLGHFEAELRAKQALVENAGKLPAELREEIATKVRSDPWAAFDDKKVRIDIGVSAFDKLDDQCIDVYNTDVDFDVATPISKLMWIPMSKATFGEVIGSID